MRCYCCNRALNDYESTLRSATTGEFLDTCMNCLDGMEIETVGREDLNWFEDPDEEYDSSSIEEDV